MWVVVITDHCCSVAQSHLLCDIDTMCASWHHRRQASLSFTISRACSNSCPLTQWCHPTISSFVIPLFPCPQSFPALGSFPIVSSSHQVAKVLELQLQHQSFQWIFRVISFRIDWFDLAVQGILKSLLPTPQFKSINSSVLSFLYGTTLTSISDY